MALYPRSTLDPGQIIKDAYDEATQEFRVRAQITANIAGAQEVIISHTDDSIRLGDGTDLVTTTTVGPDVGLDVNVIAGSFTGEFTQTGLKVSGRNTTMDVSDVAITLPAAPLTARNSLSLTNLSTVDTLYIGFASNVTPDRALGTTAGWEVGPNEGFNLDIQDNILIYGITEAGKTVRIKIMELA